MKSTSSRTSCGRGSTFRDHREGQRGRAAVAVRSAPGRTWLRGRSAAPPRPCRAGPRARPGIPQACRPRTERRCRARSASTVVTSKSMVAASMPELCFVAASIAASTVNATRCTLWSLLPTHRSTCALLTIFFNCATVLSISACVGAFAVLLPRLLDRFRCGRRDARDVDIARHFVGVDTFDRLARDRGIVEELGWIADRRENLARVEIARRCPARQGRASRRREDVCRQVVPLAVDLNPRLATAGAELGLERRLAQSDAYVHISALARRVHHSVDAEVDRLLREERELLVRRCALDVNGHVEFQLLGAGAGLRIDCAEDAGGVAIVTGRCGRARRARRVRRIARTATSCDRQGDGNKRHHCDWGSTHQTFLLMQDARFARGTGHCVSA